MDLSSSTNHFGDFSSTTTDAGLSSQASTLIVLAFIIIAIAMFLHVSGILLLFTRLSEMNNQSMLLIHYSFVSIALLSINICAVHLIGTSRYREQNSNNSSLVVVFYTIHVAYIVNLLLLTIDRLALAFLNLKYSFVMSRKMFGLQAVIMWSVAVLYGIITKYVSPISDSPEVRHDVSFAYNGFVVAFAFLSYAAIFIRIRMTSSSASTPSPTLSRDLFKRYLIPVLLVTSFMTLNLFPAIIERFIVVDDAMIASTNQTRHHDDTLTLIGLNCLHILFGPIIYVVLQRTIREKLASICHGCFHRIVVYKTISENHIHHHNTETGFRDNLGSSSLEE